MRFGVGVLVVAFAACGGQSHSHRSGAGAAPEAGTGGTTAGSPGSGGATSSVAAAGTGVGGTGVGVGGVAGAPITSTAGSSGAAEEAGAETTLPTKNGIPVGDCTDPTPEERMSEGCPSREPLSPMEYACDAAHEGVLCRYDVWTEPEFGNAGQDYVLCDDGYWSAPLGQECSVTCHAAQTGIDTLMLDTSDCSSRRVLACDPIEDYPIPPSAQVLMDTELQTLLQGCAMSKPYGFGVEVDFSDGCPSELVTSVSLDPDIVTCLAAALVGARFQCAVPLPCATWSSIPL